MEQEKDIIEGFNAGYILRSTNPDLFRQLKDSLTDPKSGYFSSFLIGAETYEQEKALELLKTNSKTAEFENPSKDKSEMDFDL